MSLPTDLEIKSYLRLDNDEEDLVIFELNRTARARVEQHLGVPLESQAETFVGRYPRKGPRREPSEQLTIPVQPCDTTATVTDVDGDTVASDTYTIDAKLGYINLVQLEVFANPPYTVAVNVGWTYHPQYGTRIDPILRQAILDLASDMWNRRNPGEVYNQSGGQVSSTYTEAPIPPRTRDLLEALRPKGRGW